MEHPLAVEAGLIGYTTPRPSVGIIGSGPVGIGLATLLALADRNVTIGTAHPSKPALRRLNPSVRVASFADAAEAETVVLSVRHGALRAVVADVGLKLAGKVVVDTTNAWIPADRASAKFSPTMTQGQWCARLLPDSQVARAYSHIDWDLLVPRALSEPGKWGAGYACDSVDAEHVVEQMIRDTGYVPVRVGTLALSADLDVGGAFFSRLLPADHMKQLIGDARPAPDLTGSGSPNQPMQGVPPRP
jgi:predicted dinucleotide-binding enzyme